MRKKFWINLALLLVIPGLLFTVSCAKKTVKTDASMAQSTSDTAADTAAADAAKAEADALAKKRALEEAELAAEKRRKLLAMQQFQNEDVYFEYDSSALLAEAREALNRKAEWLQANPKSSVVIEGHCDERGTSEYNLALGDRRSESAKSYLMDLGIAAVRLTTVSYGEERPVDNRSGEESWSKNRRAHFVIK